MLPQHGSVEDISAARQTSIANHDGIPLNASGHRDQLQRQYGLLSICGLALNIDNAWIAFGGSLAVSILNGGPPGILYEFITACAYYAFIGSSIAELASAIPSSGGVYHWASVTPGARWGRMIGFFTGSLNFFGWIFDLSSIISIPANVVVQMYAIFHPEFAIQPWHSYVAFVCITWLCTAVVIFGNSWIPKLQNVGLFLVIIGGLVTIIVVAAMPQRHATTSFVWTEWQNLTGWGGGVAFLTGVLNGAFTIGTPDAVTHLAEEMPNPKVDLPKAIFAQVGLGFVTAFCFAITILYAINDLGAVTNSNGSFPLAEVYHQATGNAGGTFGLLLIILFSILICSIGTVLMVGRLWWVLARDNATPFSRFFSNVNEDLSCPIEATVFCAILTTGLGAIQLGSQTAFLDLVGSFIILTTMSYFLAIFPHLLTKRRNVPRGAFWMGRFGFAVNGITCALIVFFNIMFCFPYAYPVQPISVMNWNSVILVGVVVITAAWWLIHGSRSYERPKLAKLYIDDQASRHDASS
ncbi:choline transport protein [Polychaeton citri CBS 116435]|uniref:Choline transport protein n=1 Tax=Polychaeton citri CBS 116435 TaxID=1314669 RepID=A0A9P4QFK8_9PEZI|nr:choline transport protein [Polychaeton citri CBS 116435]